MSVSELQVAYYADEDDVGHFVATVKSGQFSGRGAASFHRNDVRAFLARLRTYPLLILDPPTLEGHLLWADRGSLRIVIKPYDRRGTLLVDVDVASEVLETQDADMLNSATVRFQAQYGALDTFTEQFAQVVDGKRDVAVLKGIIS